MTGQGGQDKDAHTTKPLLCPLHSGGIDRVMQGEGVGVPGDDSGQHCQRLSCFSNASMWIKLENLAVQYFARIQMQRAMINVDP